jgi:hypothetical protein
MGVEAFRAVASTRRKLPLSSCSDKTNRHRGILSKDPLRQRFGTNANERSKSQYNIYRDPITTTTLTIMRKTGQVPRGTSSSGRTIFNSVVMGMLSLPA